MFFDSSANMMKDTDIRIYIYTYFNIDLHIYHIISYIYIYITTYLECSTVNSFEPKQVPTMKPGFCIK